MAECDIPHNTCNLMEKMEENLKEFLKRERIDSAGLIGYLTMRGVTTLGDFYNQDPSNMKRFGNPTQSDKLQILFEDHQILEVKNKHLQESKRNEEVGNAANRNPLYDYQIEKGPNDIIGNAIIIVNKHFTDQKTREGVEEDLNNLEKMFKRMNVSTVSHFDLDGNGMRQSLVEFATKEVEVSIVFVAISTHGDINNTVLSTDNEHIRLEGIIDIFRENKSLIGKPKIFFIQACRGDLGDERIPVSRQVSDEITRESPQSDKEIHQTFATNTSDVLIAYATSNKCLAWRDVKRGSWFITELRNSFEKHPRRHLIEILTITTNVVIQEYISKKNDTNVTECCNFHSSLTKFVFL